MHLQRIQALAAGLALVAGGVDGHRAHNNDNLHKLLRAHRNAIARASTHNDDTSSSIAGSNIIFNNATVPLQAVKRDYSTGKTCSFPSDGEIVAVAKDMKNAGWAIAPDIECVAGMYCPYACPPGQVMAQWREGSTYVYPESMDGGLYCGDDGVAKKPFEDSPYCVDGTGTVQAVNKASKGLSFCQTTLPGDESMVIPTYVGAGSSVTLAVPDITYWCETAAHYYINPPGIGNEGCIWGHKENPIGNWAAYVAGANTDRKGQTFVKIGWNPVFFEEPALMANTPKYGVKIECDDDAGCNGLPCLIDPSKGELNDVVSNNKASGAGGGDFCVVTVPKGKKARIVVFETGKASSLDVDISIGDDKEDDKKKEEEEKKKKEEEEKKKKEEEEKKKKEEEEKKKKEAEEKKKEEEEKKKKEEEEEKKTSTQEAKPTTSTADDSHSTTAARATSSTASSSRPTVSAGIFHENSSSGTDYDDEDSGDETPSSNSSPSPDGEGVGARTQGSAAAGFLVAVVALIYFI